MGTYRVTRKLGTGGVFESYVGVVRQASEQPVWLRRVVAPWSQDPALLERFQPIAEQWRLLPHDVAAPLVEWGTGADSTWVTQSLTDGESLRALLNALAAKQIRPHLNEVVAVGLRASMALATLHEQSPPLHHGDLSASTLHVTTAGAVVLTDLGLAAAAGQGANGPARSEAAVVAPEQAGGKYFSSSDVFRLGLVLHELVTGRLPPAAGAVAPGVPEKLATVLGWMLSKDPTQRPHAREVENALQVAAEQAQWLVTANVIARFVARSMPDRVPLTAIPPSGGTELTIRTSRALPPEPTTVPSGIPPPGLSPPGVTLARISTRKLTAEALLAEKEREAAEAAARAPPVMPWQDLRVADALVAKRLLSAEQLEAAVAHAESVQGAVSDAIVSLGFCDEDVVVTTEGEVTKTPVITAQRLMDTKAPDEVLTRLPAKVAEALGAVPLGVKPGDQLVVAVRDPLNNEVIDSLKRATKAAAVLAVRAGPAALARAIGSVYGGVDVDDPSSWLENANTTASHVAIKDPGFEPDSSGIELEPSVVGVDEMELESRGTIASSSKLSATLDDPQAALFDAALGLLGDRGRAAAQFVSLAGGVCRRLGASEADVGRVRFCAGAMALTNVAANKAPWELVRAEQLAPLAAGGWRSIFDLVSRALDVGKGPPSDVAMLALQAALVFSGLAGGAKTKGQPAMNALQTMKGRGYPRAVLEALSREIG